MSENSRAGIWNLLHDGSIVSLEGGVPGDVLITVNIPYLRHQFSQDGDSFIITLRDCSVLQMKIFEGPVVTDFSEIVTSDTWFLSTESTDCPISLFTNAGILEIDFFAFEIALDTGKPIMYKELEEGCRIYWDNWEKAGQRKRAERGRLGERKDIP